MDTEQISFQKRVFRIIRNALKYGDCFFVRDPETHEMVIYGSIQKLTELLLMNLRAKNPNNML